MSYLPDPPKASALYALEVPEQGGDTSFCSMSAAWAELPDRLRQRVSGLRVKHDGTYNSGGYVRQGVTPTGDPRSSPGTMHRWCAFTRYGPARSTSAAGAMPTSRDCRSTSRRRCSTKSGPKPRARPNLHQWRVGDLVLWDNRSTMHRRDAFDPTARRVMHRTQIRQ